MFRSPLAQLVFVLSMVFALVSAVRAASPDDPKNPHLWKTKTTSVAVFKNGLGFFLREGDVTLRDGWCQAEEIPPAAFGTLGIFATDEKQLVDMIGAGPGEIVEFDGADASADEPTKRTRLEASKFCNVQLTYRQRGSERAAAGKLVSVGPEFVVLESDSTSFAVPVAGIFKLQVLEMPLRVHVMSDEKDPPKKTRLGMAYLRKGITWIPEYNLRVIDDTTAELTLRGTLVNEAEDLVHCDVNFVVGVPHFLHTEFMAPIAVGQVIRTLGAAVAPAGLQTQIMSRAQIANNAAMGPPFDANGGVVDKPIAAPDNNVKALLGNLPQMEGPASTDYTVYTKKDVTLRRGEKAIVTLLRRTVPYTHIYRWSPPEALSHALVLHNQGDTAWTTGPILATSGGRPLTEDLLNYTPQGGRSEIPVTAAVNVAHEKRESEVDRKLKAHTPADNVFLDLVTLSGTLRLKNFETHEIDILIQNAIPGRPLTASDNGQISIDSTKLKLQELNGAASWHVRLKPGEEKILSYKYERYVPSN